MTKQKTTEVSLALKPGQIFPKPVLSFLETLGASAEQTETKSQKGMDAEPQTVLTLRMEDIANLSRFVFPTAFSSPFDLRVHVLGRSVSRG